VVAVLLLGRRLHPLFPAILAGVVGAILLSRFAGFGGPTVGKVHAGLPPFTTSLPLHELPRLIVPKFVIALIGLAEASSIARTDATLDRQRWDADRAFVSQGVANVGAGLFGGFPVGASFWSGRSSPQSASPSSSTCGANCGSTSRSLQPSAGSSSHRRACSGTPPPDGSKTGSSTRSPTIPTRPNS
jgi:SulP family sulfate permease